MLTYDTLQTFYLQECNFSELLILQIERCLRFFLANETFTTLQDAHPTRTAPESAVSMGSLGGIRTEFSLRGQGLGDRQFNMDVLIFRLAREMSTLQNDVSSDAHGQQWRRMWKSITGTNSQSYYQRNAEKLVGNLVYILISIPN